MNSLDDFEILIEQRKQEELQRRERLAKVKITTGAELMQKDFPEPRYLWDSALPDAGLAVMAASKAAGKTLLLLQLANAISRGREFLGLPTQQTKVLYLQLEVSERRTQQRLLKMGLVANESLHFAHHWLCGEEGLLTIADAVKEYSFGLVIVDVMQLLWPMDADTNSYQDVYSVLAPLRQLANDLGVMILLVTHRRKAETSDYLDGVIGSVGIAANADVVFTLTRTRGEREAILHIDGNDIESKKLVLRFNIDPLGFSLSDASPAEACLTPERREIVETIRQLGGTAKPGQVAAMLGKDRSNVGHLMQAMAEMGVLELKRTGVYAIRSNIPIIPTVPTLSEEWKTGNSGNTGNDDGHAALLFDDQDNASELEHRAPRGSRTYEGRMAGS
jgi:DNA-binding transcriptional ArsR family regulator